MKRFSMAVLVVALMSGVAFAQPEEEKKEGGGPPPALVTVAEITEGEVQPMGEFVGSVFYTRVSDVAAEVEGSVLEVKFEEGRIVSAGTPLVVLSSEILDASIASTEASLGQVEVELEKARKDFGRIEKLYKEESVAESLYDEHLFKVRGLEMKEQSLQAELDRLRIEKEKKTIKAPFGGVVLEKTVEDGEWVSPGGKVAVVAGNGEVDVIVDVPERILGYLKRGSKVAVRSGGRELSGTVRALIPEGDVATRTFPVKIRVKNPSGVLSEGMEARVVLPSSEKIKGLMVHRDAVIKPFGMDVVFVIAESKAKMVPVSITGYYEEMVGISGPGLEAGGKVAVKGNERIRDGQPVTVINKDQ